VEVPIILRGPKLERNFKTVMGGARSFTKNGIDIQKKTTPCLGKAGGDVVESKGRRISRALTLKRLGGSGEQGRPEGKKGEKGGGG